MGKRGPAPRVECVNGHELTADNIRLVRRGDYVERQCLTCARRRAREWWQANRAKSEKGQAS